MINQNQFNEKISSYLAKMDEKKQPLSLEISGEGLTFSFQKTNHAKPFHLFGVTKLVMAYLVEQLNHLNQLDLDEPIYKYLDENTLKHLFVFRDVDYQKNVTIRMLLDHTSGIADYFEGINDRDEQFITQLLTKKDDMYTPADLIAFTKKYQVAMGIPGQRYYYSDTGYVLLGLVLESMTKQSLDQLIRTYVIDPLKLKDTQLFHPEMDFKAVEDVSYNGHDIKSYKSLSAHWGGSGLISTHHDMLNFIKQMTYKDQPFPHTFIKGIRYGLGMMQLRLDHLSFLSRTSIKTPLYGHMSFYGTHLWIEPESGLSISLNYGSNKAFEKSFKVIAFIIKTYHQMIEEA